MKTNKIIIISLMIGLIVGLFMGIIIQQIIIIKSISKVEESLEGFISNMNIEIDINETKIVEATYKLFSEVEKIK